VWEYLRRFQHVGYTAPLLASQNPTAQRTDWNEKASDIAVCINQAEAFYQSAASSALRIKPLLLYYGMLALAKALIIAGDNPYKLSPTGTNGKLATTHGLTLKPYRAQDEVVRQGTEISNEFCYYQGGLFKQLRQCYARTPIALPSPHQPPPCRFEVKDLLSLLPDDWEKFCSYFDTDWPNVVRVKDDWYGARNIRGVLLGGPRQHVIRLDLSSNSALTQAHCRRAPNATGYLACIEPIFSGAGYSVVPNGKGCLIKTDPCGCIDDNLVVVRDSGGDSYALVSPFPFNVNDIDVHYVLMYILSNLVRYYPAKWARVAAFSGTDELYLLEGFIETSMVRFPNLILNELSCRHFDFVLSVGR
jgi:hypothetical protein